MGQFYFNSNKEFPLWGEIGKWVGIFKLRWIYLRDIHFEKLHYNISKDINLNDLKDGTKIE